MIYYIFWECVKCCPSSKHTACLHLLIVYIVCIITWLGDCFWYVCFRWLMLVVTVRWKTIGQLCKYDECLPNQSQRQVRYPLPSRVTVLCLPLSLCPFVIIFILCVVWRLLKICHEFHQVTVSYYFYSCVVWFMELSHSCCFAAFWCGMSTSMTRVIYA